MMIRRVLMSFAVCAAVACFADNESCRRAEDVVNDQLKSAGIRQGFDRRTRTIVLVSSECASINPIVDTRYFERRNALVARVFDEARAEICRVIKSDYSKTEPPREGVNREETVSSSSDLELYGCQVVSQAESFNGQEYEIALAVKWSPQSEKAAKALALGKGLARERSGEPVKTWLARNDLGFMLGSRQHVDENGSRYFLGIASRNRPGTPELDEIADHVSRIEASGSLFNALATVISSCRESKMSQTGESVSESMTDRLTCSGGPKVLKGLRTIERRECKDSITGGIAVIYAQGADVMTASSPNVLGSEVLRNGGMDSFRGSVSFAWRKGVGGFLRKRNESLKRAFVDALAGLCEFSGVELVAESTSNCAFETDARKDARVVQGEPNVTIDKDFSNLTWRYVLTKKGVLEADNLMLSSKRQISMRAKADISIPFSVEQTERYDANAGRYFVEVFVRPGRCAKGASIKDWVGSCDLAVTEGPRQFVDADGHRWLVGFASLEKDGDEKTAQATAERSAITALHLAYGGEVSSDCDLSSFLGFASDERICSCENVSVKRAVVVDRALAKRLAPVDKRKFVCEATHPASGKRMKVVVYAVDLTSVK